MEERINKEWELMKTFKPDIRYHKNGHWFYIPSYPLPEGWNKTETEIAFQVKPGYPSTHPYAFYVPTGLRFKGQMPKNYQEPAKKQPPFEGQWGQMSWTISTPWKPAADIVSGSNLLNWVMSFEERFKEGV